MPSKQPKLLSRKDNYELGSQVTVASKYGKRERKVNTRPEGDYKVIRAPSNPNGEVLAGGGYEAMYRRRRMDAPKAVTVNASDFEELAALTEKEEKLQLTLQQFYFLVSKKRFVWFCAGYAAGKCLDPDTPVMLHSGKIIKCKEVVPGDLLMGPDSKPRRVLSTTSGVDNMYRITPKKGDSWICNEPHVLTLVDCYTNEIVDVPLNEYLPNKHRKKYRAKRQFRVGVDFDSSEKLDLDPYFAGVWLGDGDSNHGLKITNGEPEIMAYLKDYAESNGLLCKVSYDNRNSNIVYNRIRHFGRPVDEKGFMQPNPLWEKLKPFRTELGKRIPHNYLTASREDRLSLLAGLLDTDGYYQKGYEIATKFEGLKDDILFLCRSLGLAAYASKKYVKEKLYWRIYISGELDVIPCKVERKKAEPRKQNKSVLRTGFSVEPLGPGEYFGFELDGDGRFLLGDFTVTHNTIIGSWWVYMRIIQCPQSLGLIGANTHDQLNQSTLKPFMEFLDTIGMPYVLNRQPPKEWGLPRLFKEYDNIMVFPNGSHVLLRSLDNPTNLAGLTLGWFWIDETAYSSPEVWKVIVSRLRCSKADVVMGRVTSTPEGQNWLYDIFKSDAELYKIIFQSVMENPFIKDREQFIRSQLAFMDESQVEQYIHGRIVQVKFGRVYHQFSDKNVKSKYEYERRRELLLCWDFNSGAAPMSLIVAQRFFCPKSGRKQIQVIDEFIKEYSDTKEICSLFIAKYGPNGKNHLGRITVFGDAYGDKTTSKSDYAVMKNELEIAFREELLSFDNIMGGNPEQQDRINAMNTGFRNSLGQRDIFINPECKKLIFDLNNVKPKDGDGIQIQKTGQTKIDKAKNIKLTHPSDAFGYLIVREIQVIKRNSAKAVKRNNVMIVGGQH